MDHKKLSEHFKILAQLEETTHPVISCYINNEKGRLGYRDSLDARIKEIRKSVPGHQRQDFEQALGKIETFLAAEAEPDAKGIAIFSRGGTTPFFKALQFRLPLPNALSIDTVPHIYELVFLKDTYHRYILLISTETQARIVEVCVGHITRELWAERPELRKRVGREWTQEHYQSHRRDRSQKFIKDKIKILDRLMSHDSNTHLILAGSPKTITQVRENLPKHLVNKLVNVVSTSSNQSTEDVVNTTLSTFAEYEQKESLETSSLLLDELRKGQLAVSGTEVSLEALARGQVDVLVLCESYSAPLGWKCADCKFVGIGLIPKRCLQCGDQGLTQINLKEEMIRTAEQLGSTVEIVRDSDALHEIGNIGCLLRYLTPEQHALRNLHYKRKQEMEST